jgi:hypothetical protein
VAAVGGTGRSPSWRVSSAFIRTGSTTGRSSCWTGRRAFSKAAVARACWERGGSKSVVLLTGTEGSNPSPSSGESANFRSLARPTASCALSGDMKTDPLVRRHGGQTRRAPTRGRMGRSAKAPRVVVCARTAPWHLDRVETSGRESLTLTATVTSARRSPRPRLYTRAKARSSRVS